MKPIATVIDKNRNGNTVNIGVVETYTNPDILSHTLYPYIALSYRSTRASNRYPLWVSSYETVEEAVTAVREEYKKYGTDSSRVIAS